MGHEDVEAHLLAVGIRPLRDRFEPIAPEVWKAIEARSGGSFPDVVRWLFTRFGGSRFEDGAYYADPHMHGDAAFGWFLDGDELASVYEWTRESMPRDIVGIANDGSDNFVCVGIGAGNAGVVSFYLHDAPTDRKLHQIADSVEDFLFSLQRETEAGMPEDRVG